MPQDAGFIWQMAASICFVCDSFSSPHHNAPDVFIHYTGVKVCANWPSF